MYFKNIVKISSYGYEGVTILLGYGFKIDIKGKTIYPLLVRLRKKGIITSRCLPFSWGPSENVHYTRWSRIFEQFKTNWKQISVSGSDILIRRYKIMLNKKIKKSYGK